MVIGIIFVCIVSTISITIIVVMNIIITIDYCNGYQYSTIIVIILLLFRLLLSLLSCIFLLLSLSLILLYDSDVWVCVYNNDR